MCLGALVDAGVSIEDIGLLLRRIPVRQYHLRTKKVSRSGVAAVKVDVVLDRGYKASAVKWKDITAIIKKAKLDENIRAQGLQVFKKLFEAEAKVHGQKVEEVHLHELGGTDCMVDIFGTLIGLDLLGVHKIYTSPVNLGSGTVKCGHGALPVPAPATAELLKGFPVYASGVPFELATPTGAAILAGLEAETGPVPSMSAERIGYGAGNRDIEHMPNALRVFIGEAAETDSPLLRASSDTDVIVIETNIDDMNPQLYEDVIDKLFAAGALDVFLENIIMKKGRPAVKLTVIADERKREYLTSLIFNETTTIGLRFYSAGRRVLDREIRKIKTLYGEVRIKIARLEGAVINISPEYTDLKALSKKTGQPIKRISEEIAARVAEVGSSEVQKRGSERMEILGKSRE